MAGKNKIPRVNKFASFVPPIVTVTLTVSVGGDKREQVTTVSFIDIIGQFLPFTSTKFNASSGNIDLDGPKYRPVMVTDEPVISAYDTTGARHSYGCHGNDMYQEMQR